MNLPRWSVISGALLVTSMVANADVALPVIRTAAARTNLLLNPGFDRQQGNRLSAWSAAKNGFQLGPGEGRLQTQALVCENSDDQAWSGASQTVILNQTNPAPLVVEGWSRSQNVSGGEDNGYSLYVDLLYTDGTPLWGQTVGFRPGTHDWEERRLVILPAKPVKSLTLHCLLRGHSGKAWFDDIAVHTVEPPAGAALFQGTPVALGRPRPNPRGPASRFSSQDGLRLEMVDGQIVRWQIGGRELAASAPSGFLARDVAADSDFMSFTENRCPELGLQIDARYSEEPTGIAVEGRVMDTTGRDRAILLAFALPLDAQGWDWTDDIRRSRRIQGVTEYSNLVSVHSGTTGSQSVYPLACVHDNTSGVAMAIDMGRPAQYRLAYNAGTKQLLLVYDFGLVRETARFPSAAPFRFVLYRVDPDWGFRSAFQKLTELFPDYFRVRSREQGIWMPFTDVSKVEQWQDFGFRYHEGNNNIPFDDEHGILSFRYTEPMTWWMRMAPELPRDETTALKVRDEYAAGRKGQDRQMAEVTRSAAMYTADDGPALIFRNEPWANGAVWSLNPNPALPAQPNAATIHWNDEIKQRLYGESAQGKLDGEYLDSLEGYVTAELNYRREHFRYTTVPLTFASESHRPALAKGLAVAEFTRWISDDLHRFGKLCFANGVPYRFGYLCPWLDVLGTETDWLSAGRYQPASHSQMALWRTLSGGKPYLLLMNTDYDKFGPELVERYFQRSLFYGFYPSMFSHNASENPYWLNAKWYNRDRSLFKRYLPLVKLVAEAGWQPVTGARSDNPHILVERFGSASARTCFYTAFNDTPDRQTGSLRESGGSISRASVATELLSGKGLPQQAEGWLLDLGPEEVAVLRVDQAAAPAQP